MTCDPMVHVPGLWRCAKCDFTLMQSNLNARDGTVSARDQAGDRCQNCDAPLWRVTWKEQAQELMRRCEEMHMLINTPETMDFLKGVQLEAAHQRERWPSDHDAGKSPFDWFWLIGFLSQKAAASAVAGDFDKARHHTISTAAALANWHLAIAGVDNVMRPGIEPPG